MKKKLRKKRKVVDDEGRRRRILSGHYIGLDQEKGKSAQIMSESEVTMGKSRCNANTQKEHMFTKRRGRRRSEEKKITWIQLKNGNLVKSGRAFASSNMDGEEGRQKNRVKLLCLSLVLIMRKRNTQSN